MHTCGSRGAIARKGIACDVQGSGSPGVIDASEKTGSEQAACVA